MENIHMSIERLPDSLSSNQVWSLVLFPSLYFYLKRRERTIPKMYY